MYTCRVLGSTFTMYVLLILVLTTCLCTARARVVIASRLPNKHKYNVTTPSVNDVTKWTGSINPGDTPEFLEQDLAVGWVSSVKVVVLGKIHAVRSHAMAREVSKHHHWRTTVHRAIPKDLKIILTSTHFKVKMRKFSNGKESYIFKGRVT